MNVKNKFDLYIILSAVFIVILITGLAFHNHKGTYSLEDDPSVTIDCPAAISTNEEVMCNVFLTATNINALSLTANYDIDANILYDDIYFEAEEICEINDCTQELVSTENGFTITNQEGINTDTKIGTIRFTIVGEPNDEYEVGLVNIELSNSENEIINLEDASATIRIKNNNAKLTNIEINKTALEENFDDENNTYTATIADNGEETDTVTLTLTKSDEFATIDGEIENLELHYGKNTFTIEVISEDENVTNEYTIEITRQFDFDPENSEYVYNSEDNYLYIKNDLLDAFHNNLKILPENMTYHVNNGKLEILYEEEVIKSIDIIYFESDYVIIGNNMYIERGLNLEQLKTKITSDVLDFKYFDNTNNELLDNDYEIQNNNKVKVYYEETELGNYNLSFEYFTIDDSLVLDNDKNILKRIKLGTTYGELKSMINTSGTITIETDTTANDEYKIRTGDQLSIKIGAITLKYKLSVIGCIDNDEEVTLTDVLKIYRHLKHRLNLSNEYLSAADITNDGSIGLDDVIIIYRYLKGKTDTLENGGGM